MSNTNGLISLLGEENVEMLKKNIVQLIVEQIKEDIENYGEYLLYPPDMQDIVKDAMEDAQKKVSKMYKDAVIEINKDYIDKMKSYMSKQVKDPEKVMRREIIELAKSLKYHNDVFGRNEKLAQRLYEIARATQEEIEADDIVKHKFDLDKSAEFTCEDALVNLDE